MLLPASSKEALHGGEGTLEVVKPGSGYEFLPASPDGARGPVIQEEVMAQDVLRLYSCGFRHKLHEASLCLLQAEEGDHVHLRIIGIALIGLPVHMDRHIGDQQCVPVQIHQAFLRALFSLHKDPSCHGQGPVEPGSAEHASVFFHVQGHIVALHQHLRILLDLEGRGVGMAGGDMKALSRLLRNGEGDQGRMVT